MYTIFTQCTKFKFKFIVIQKKIQRQKKKRIKVFNFFFKRITCINRTDIHHTCPRCAFLYNVVERSLYRIRCKTNKYESMIYVFQFIL